MGQSKRLCAPVASEMSTEEYNGLAQCRETSVNLHMKHSSSFSMSVSMKIQCCEKYMTQRGETDWSEGSIRSTGWSRLFKDRSRISTLDSVRALVLYVQEIKKQFVYLSFQVTLYGTVIQDHHKRGCTFLEGIHFGHLKEDFDLFQFVDSFCTFSSSFPSSIITTHSLVTDWDLEGRWNH